ncbi:hypothetical protein PG993_000162 [Apiospora rasikravindrae]|uniref:C2H2-type domain-containing protein n=1 Tax=Apiospora rasikravindrae TaxID=990691 RepID=A0ABR1UA14_9PEZI
MPVEMADASDSAHNNDPEQPKAEHVSDIFASLMETFGSVLLKLDGDSEISDSPILEAAYEQCTRLKVWGLQNRVSAPNGAPGSLGGLLKEQPEVEQLVFEVLRDANAWLSKILQGVEEGGAMVLGETSSRLEGDSDTSSTSSSDSSTAPGLVTYLKRTFENVGELYRLQSLLRKPRMKGKYLHSGQPRPDLPGYQQDYQHVRQKLDDWQRNFDSDADEQEKPESEAKPESHAEPDEDPGVSPDSLHQRQQAEEKSQGLTDILCRRLASANSKRRKQLKYWQSHPYHHLPIQDISGGGLYQSQPAKRLPVAKGITKEAVTDNDAPMSEKVPTTVHSFSTAPRSAILIAEKSEAVDNGVARTTYQPSVVGTGPRTTMRVPDVPQITGGGGATKCPYCQVPLSSEILANRENWKRHVFRDLRPYVCTARSCTDPEKQFAARYDWIYHERQLHHRQWDCSECSEVFESRDAFLSHTYRSHGGDWTERQIAILASMRERAKDDTAWSDCPLCLSAMQHLKLFEHVAGHLEEIALFSLPRDAVSTEEDEGISNEAREDITRYSSESDRNSWSLFAH